MKRFYSRKGGDDRHNTLLLHTGDYRGNAEVLSNYTHAMQWAVLTLQRFDNRRNGYSVRLVRPEKRQTSTTCK